MSQQTWMVEREIESPKEVRNLYKNLLKDILAALEEEDKTEIELDGPKYTVFVYDLPTVIFSHVYENLETGKTMLQLVCYRDRQDFIESESDSEEV